MSWDNVKLSEIATITMGQSPKSEFFNFLGDGIPFMQGKTEFGAIYPTISKYTTKTTRLASKNSILFTVRAPVGALNIANQDICIGRGLASINSNDGNNSFLYYLIKNNTKLFLSQSGEGVYDSINKTNLGNVELFIPLHIEKRNKIGDILSAYDDLIENNLKRIKLLEQAAQNIYKEWFVNMRFPGHDASTSSATAPIDQETGLPEGWSISKYKNHFDVLTGKKDANHSNENGKYPFFTCGKEIIKSPDYSFDCEAILLAGNGDFNVKYYRGKFQAYQRTYVLSPFKSEELFLIFIHLDINLKHLTHGSKGSVIKYLTKGMIENVEFVLPNDLILHRFNNLCLNIFSKIENLKLLNHKLKSARDILLPRLMNQTIEV